MKFKHFLFCHFSAPSFETQQRRCGAASLRAVPTTGLLANPLLNWFTELFRYTRMWKPVVRLASCVLPFSAPETVIYWGLVLCGMGGITAPVVELDGNSLIPDRVMAKEKPTVGALATLPLQYDSPGQLPKFSLYFGWSISGIYVEGRHG